MEIKNNKRIINARPIFLIFIALIFGIYLMYKSYELRDNLQFDFALLFLILWAIIFISWLVLYFIKKDNLFFSIIRRDFKYLLMFTLALIVGIVITFGTFRTYFNLEKYDNYSCMLAGTVEEISTWNIVLKDCEIIGENCEEKLHSGVILETNGEELNLTENAKIKVLCKLSIKPIFRSSVNLSKFISGSAYSIVLDDDTYITNLSNNGNTLAYSIRDYVKNILFDSMNEENAGISFAMLFGKKDFITNDNLDAFSMAGISHILAVSGLHIGVLVAVLYFVLKMIFKNKSLTIILLIGGFLIFYSYLCDFSPSVVRATIMSLVLLISREYGYRYDALNSLSIAGIIILILNPLSLFSAGFQLSFLCIFSIITLAPFITEMFTKICLPKKLASALAISFSTNIAILPICANLFNKLSLISIFANLIIIPFFSLSFVLLFGFVLVACIIKPLGFLLIIPEITLHGIKLLANAFANVEVLYITLFNVSYILLFLVVLMSFFIHFLLINKKAKAVLCGSLISIMLFILVFANLPLNFNNNALIFSEFSSNNISILVTNRNDINLIGYNRNDYLRENFLVKNKVRKVSTILAYNFEFNMLNSLEEFVLKYNVEKVILPNEFAEYENLFDEVKSRIEFIENNAKIGKFLIMEYKTADNSSLGIELYDEQTRILFANVSYKSQWSKLINQIENKIDIMFVERYNYNCEDFNVQVDNLICNSGYGDGKNITKLIYNNDFTMAF